MLNHRARAILQLIVTNSLLPRNVAEVQQTAGRKMLFLNSIRIWYEPNAEREDVFRCVHLEVETQIDLMFNLLLWGSIDLNYYWLIRKLLIT